MATFQLTNQTASQALRGQDAIATVNQTQQSQLTTLAVGNKVTIGSSANIGYISEIDSLGYTFRFKPAQDSGRCDSVQPGILLSGEILTILQS